MKGEVIEDELLNGEVVTYVWACRGRVERVLDVGATPVPEERLYSTYMQLYLQ